MEHAVRHMGTCAYARCSGGDRVRGNRHAGGCMKPSAAVSADFAFRAKKLTGMPISQLLINRAKSL